MKKTDTLLVEGFLDYSVSVKTLSGSTIKAYREDLKRFAVYLDELGLSLSEVDDMTARGYIAELSRNNAAKTSVNRHLSALRSFYEYLVRHQGFVLNPFKLIKSLKQGRRLPEFLFENEVEGYVRESGSGFSAVRNTLIFEFLYGTGCRISELVSMELKDIDFKEKSVLVRGKGGKERLVFFGESAGAALKAYLPFRSARVSSKDRDSQNALFLNQRGTRLSVRGAFYIIKRASREQGTVKKVTPHTFRHSFATHLINRGADIRVVQELLGHVNLSTTQIYTHMGLARLKRIYDGAHPHGKRKKEQKDIYDEYEL